MEHIASGLVIAGNTEGDIEARVTADPEGIAGLGEVQLSSLTNETKPSESIAHKTFFSFEASARLDEQAFESQKGGGGEGDAAEGQDNVGQTVVAESQSLQTDDPKSTASLPNDPIAARCGAKMWFSSVRKKRRWTLDTKKPSVDSLHLPHNPLSTPFSSLL